MTSELMADIHELGICLSHNGNPLALPEPREQAENGYIHGSRREMIERGDRRRAPAHRIPRRAPRKLDDRQAAQKLSQYRSSLLHRAKMTRMELAKTVIENTPKRP
jgi:hypothetical protein